MDSLAIPFNKRLLLCGVTELRMPSYGIAIIDDCYHQIACTPTKKQIESMS